MGDPTEFRQGAIQCGSTVVDSYSTPPGQFDLVVVTSSWDERAIVVTRDAIAARSAVLVTFENKGTSGRREAHDVALRAWADEYAADVHSVHGSSENVYAIWEQLEVIIDECRRDAGRPIRVLFDLSTCPRYLALATLQLCLGSGVAYEVVFTYAEAEYPDQSQTNDRYELFTAGTWETLAVPGLVGTYDPALERHYVVAVGFEGSKTLRTITRADPDEVTVLFPDPAVAPDYVERTRRNNATLFEEWAIDEGKLIRAGAADVVGAWQALADSAALAANVNQFLLCAGTKPHALAMGLIALATGRPAVLYVKPASHKEAHITPSGTFWTYAIRDMTIGPVSAADN